MINNNQDPNQPLGQPTHSRSLMHWAIFVLIVVIAGVLVYSAIGNLSNNVEQPLTNVSVPESSVELALAPEKTTVKVGDVIETNIVLDTGKEKIDGTDIFALHFDPNLLKVVDDMPNQSGIQIKPGQILSLNTANIVDNTAGTIKLGQVAPQGTTFEGRGVLATIHFKALAAGSAALKIDFKPGNTTDSNAAYKGSDKLTKVGNATYTIQP